MFLGLTCKQKRRGNIPHPKLSSHLRFVTRGLRGGSCISDGLYSRKDAAADVVSRVFAGRFRRRNCYSTVRRDTMTAHRALWHQPQFGGTPIGCTSSTNFAAESIRGSENLGPTICRPTGSLAEVRPAGTLAAGSAASDTRKVGPIQSMYILIFLPSTTSG